MEGELVLFIIAGILAAGIFIAERVRWKRNVRKRCIRKIREEFGTCPDMSGTPEYKKIGILAGMAGKEKEVDDITWSDLSMDTIFQRINRCESAAGEEVLYEMLHRTGKTKEEDAFLDSLLSFYEEKEDARVEAQKTLLKLGKTEAAYYIPAYLNVLTESHVGNIRIFRLLQAVLGTSLIFGILLMQPVFLSAALFTALVNVVLYSMKKGKYEQELSMLEAMVAVTDIARELGKSCPDEMAERLLGHSGIYKRIGRVQHRLCSFNYLKRGSDQGLFLDYMMGLTLWQLTAYETSIRYIEQKKKEYAALFSDIGLTDAAISIVSFRKSLPFYCIPEFTEEKIFFAEDMYHPLIENPVVNSVEWKKNCMITGSNASGKSTFIKAAAVNAILAQSVRTCMASRLRMRKADVMTSMAVRDDIMSGDSYFIKEIKYMQRMLKHLEAGKTTFCIIDEILKGTNTKERIAASTAILRYFCRKDCLVMAASHDYELTVRLEGIYENYHFTEQIGKEDIYFDYKLRKGAVMSGNAIRLLEFTGFPKSIIEEAKAAVDKA